MIFELNIYDAIEVMSLARVERTVVAHEDLRTVVEADVEEEGPVSYLPTMPAAPVKKTMMSMRAAA